jgi:hypothetical protein
MTPGTCWLAVKPDDDGLYFVNDGMPNRRRPEPPRRHLLVGSATRGLFSEVIGPEEEDTGPTMPHLCD